MYQLQIHKSNAQKGRKIAMKILIWPIISIPSFPPPVLFCCCCFFSFVLLVSTQSLWKECSQHGFHWGGEERDDKRASTAFTVPCAPIQVGWSLAGNTTGTAGCLDSWTKLLLSTSSHHRYTKQWKPEIDNVPGTKSVNCESVLDLAWLFFNWWFF